MLGHPVVSGRSKVHSRMKMNKYIVVELSPVVQDLFARLTPCNNTAPRLEANENDGAEPLLFVS